MQQGLRVVDDTLKVAMTSLRLDDAGSNRIANKPGNIVNIEFVHDVGAMRFSGLGADAENGGKLLGGFTFGYQL